MRSFALLKLSRTIQVSLLFISAGLAYSQLSPEQAKGKNIYLHGSHGGSGEITAVLNGGNVVPASVVPCAGCHGRDGLGRTEGGVAVPALTWDRLTRGSDGNAPYTRTLLKRAVCMGVSSRGLPLEVMPRYQLNTQDFDDLLAYLQVLDADRDPGITDSELRVGVILPSGPKLSTMRNAMESVLSAFENDLNHSGGIFERKLVLRFCEPPESLSQRMGAIRAFLDRENIFAFVSSVVAGAEEQISALMQEHEVPLIGAFTLYPESSAHLNPYVFYLQPGIAEQARALVQFAARNSRQKPLKIWISHESPMNVPELAKAECEVIDRPALADAVLLLSASEAQRILALDHSLLQHPMYLIPGSLLTFDLQNLPQELRQRIYLASPVLSSDATAGGLAWYQALAARHQIAPDRIATQWSALSAALLFVEALKETGRNTSREQLIKMLEGINHFQTGLLPPLTFGPNRRIGSLGSHVSSAADPSHSVWIDLD